MDRCKLAYTAVTSFEEYSKDDDLKNEEWAFAEYTSAMYGRVLTCILDHNMDHDDAVSYTFNKHSKEEYETAKRITEEE